MASASEEVRKLKGKEGSATELIRQYLEAKKANFSIVKVDPGENVSRVKRVDPFIEPGSIMIEKNGKMVIIEELTKVCGVSGRYHDTDEKTNVNAILDRSKRVFFKTYKDKKDLYIMTETKIKEPTFGLYLGGGEINVNMKDVLKEPSKIPDYDETFEINCDCESGKLKCKANVWEF